MVGLVEDDSFESRALARYKCLGEDTGPLLTARLCQTTCLEASITLGEAASNSAFYVAFLVALNSICQREGLNTGATVTPTGRQQVQVSTYLDAYESWHGFLTGFDSTVIFWRMPEQQNLLRCTRAFHSTATDPTIIMLLYHMMTESEVLRLEKEEVPERKRRNDKDREPRAGKRQRQKAKRQSAELTSSSGSRLLDPSLVPIDELNLSMALAHTESSPFMLGWYMNVECAIKAGDVDKCDVAPYFRGPSFLERLADLDCVVDLLELGRTWGGGSIFLAAAHVKGRQR
ncbi:hypothetical protein COCSUDRAFT_58413 [Coccomyxa subellipsoidea C-169]|uniref:Uncharacterized protein n=1 Tax=Coccomyxa subellipsoidea (strain C-169) TaxID=574566 RepID=I0YMQ4_COCSC|nr:hypothetical protein COCSUDRAFT_58413 [Coccomyxa subellipsoidea C-169]EIE19673.1 hypothetical protein COCSUDRAFT_58413 [Coccomyxa subellipsoidea C-169]|eukprot:XP_005644217.1 hypothetical protein COCSUDRAFT_58413 [Coccomyxa subellipsoidea C-169]